MKLENLKADSSIISTFEYQLENVGNRLGVLEATGLRTTWGYDATYQLLNEHRPAAGPAGYNITYTYDPLGNRLVMNEAGALTSYSYDTANQLQLLVDARGTTTFTYDVSDNQQIENAPTGRTTNTWDYENQLTRVDLPSGARVTMPYDTDVIRVRKET